MRTKHPVLFFSILAFGWYVFTEALFIASEKCTDADWFLYPCIINLFLFVLVGPGLLIAFFPPEIRQKHPKAFVTFGVAIYPTCLLLIRATSILLSRMNII